MGAVAALELSLVALVNGIYELIEEGFSRDVTDLESGEIIVDIVADGMEQMSLAQTRGTVDEQRVVGLGRSFGDCECSGMGEAIGGAYDERLEGVAGLVKRRKLVGERRGVARG